MRDTIFVDMDNTVAIIDDKEEDLRARWVTARPREEVIKLLASLKGSDYMIYMIAARPVIFELETVRWLGQNAVPYWRLFFYRESDETPTIQDAKKRLCDKFELWPRLLLSIDAHRPSLLMWHAHRVACLSTEWMI